MDGQMRLMRGEAEALTLTAHYEPRCGWTFRLRLRHTLETWPEATDDRYDHLTTEELYDTLCAALAAQLRV